LHPSPGGFQADSPAQRLTETFTASGAFISSGATRVGLVLRAVGDGRSLVPLASVPPTARSNRVTYTHPRMTEWYANGPLGLEQGFSIAKAPSAHSVGALVLSMALSGNAQPVLAPDARSITFTHPGGPPLRYGSLIAADARDRRLPSSLRLSDGTLTLRVDTRGARYPLRIDPLVQQGKKLTGTDESGKAQFGFSVALSSDGNTALIGARYDGYSGHEATAAGAAWVFTRTGSAWAQQGGKLTGEQKTGRSDFGESVALSADGNTALIGAPYERGDLGAATVFTRSGSTWTQQGPRLIGEGEGGSAFLGGSVALSADGNTALISGIADSNSSGAVWVFTRSGSSWTQQGKKLTDAADPAGCGCLFGESVALSSDGNTALIGAPRDDEGQEPPKPHTFGAALVFTRSGSTWTEQGNELTGATARNFEGGPFGLSVALSSDGNTALIAGYCNNNRGGVWAFTRSGSMWSQPGTELTGADQSGACAFGSSVSLSSDGNTALIGGPQDSEGFGAAWIFTRSGSTWTQQGRKLRGAKQSGGGLFGQSVALSSDGSTALVGGPIDNGSVGAVWAFAPGTPCSELEVQTVVLPDATRGAPYRAELMECDGTPPYRWNKVGTLPKGLKLSKAGVLEGTPSSRLVAGSYAVGVKVTDSEKPRKVATANLTLKIN
jgi:hypothetical protein